MTTPEARARLEIDRLLTAAGWVVQDYADLNLLAGVGVAIREFPLATGFTDYLETSSRSCARRWSPSSSATRLRWIA